MKVITFTTLIIRISKPISEIVINIFVKYCNYSISSSPLRRRCKEEEIDEKEEPGVQVSLAVVRAAEAATEEVFCLLAVPEATTN